MRDDAVAGGTVRCRGRACGVELSTGRVLSGIDAVWGKTGDRAYLKYIQSLLIQFLQPDGSIRTYKPETSSLNDIVFGRRLLMLYRVTKDESTVRRRRCFGSSCLISLGRLREASGIRGTIRTSLVDDLFMANPFYAEYATMFHEPQDFADITKQFELLDKHARDAKSGLLYHGWDECRTQAGANKVTGTSPNLWARGMGWYMMALSIPAVLPEGRS